MSTADDLARAIRARAETGARRFIVALAGAPGAGKSTLVASLARDLGQVAAVVPMDGYHIDNAVLDDRGQRARKGAPWTFDVAGLSRDLERLRADDGPVLVPVFDRDLDLSRAAARQIAPEARILLVEGNYLLVQENPWSSLARFWDLDVMLSVPEDELNRRLVARWLAHGHSPDAARARAEGNDLPNARYVITHSRPAQIVITS